MSTYIEVRASKKAHRFDAFVNGEYIGEIRSIKVSRYDRNARYRITGSPEIFDDLDEACAVLVGREEKQ